MPPPASSATSTSSNPFETNANVSGPLIRFDPDVMDWKSWRFRFRNYILLTNFPSDKHRELLIESLDVKPFQMLVSMCQPKEPSEFTFDQLLEKLDVAYTRVTFKVTEWANFFVMKQRTGEELVGFANRLRDATITCSFTAEILEDALSAVFIAGLVNDSTRRTLMSQELKSFDETINVARKYETGQQDSRRSNQESVKATNRQGRPFNRRSDQPRPTETGSKPPCQGCGSRNHLRSDCPFKEESCRKCGRKGHIQKVCRSGGKSTKQISRLERTYDVLKTGHFSTSTFAVPVKVNGYEIELELDTGSEVTIVTENTWSAVGKPRLKPFNSTLTSFTGHTIKILGVSEVSVIHPRQPTLKRDLELLVVKHGGNVLGRDWMRELKLQDLRLSEITVNQVNSLTLEGVLQINREAFRDELGCCSNFKAHLYVKPEAKPRFCKARTLPFAVKEAVEEDIKRLLDLKVIEPVDHSNWAAPIVAVQKKGRKVRICADLSTGLNDALDVHRYPLPLPDELFAALNGGQKFSKVDLSDAYLQVPLDSESRELVTINTHKGLFRYNRLPFGVASAPSIFQQLMDTLLQGCEGASAYLDDIIVTGATDAEHLRNLNEVLRRIAKNGMTLKKEKCEFMKESVEYLGFVIDRQGRHISSDKAKAVLDMPNPKDIGQLRSFLGMINHYAKFLPNLSGKCDLFHKLLQKDTPWKWDSDCEKRFSEIKKGLGEATLLVHFDPELPLIMAADASPTGIGAVISHRYPDGSEKPIAHASKTLSSTEQNYAQIEKEALGLVYGVKKFHQYLAGREFTLLTDHKPLVSVFGSKQGIPSVTANRLQRWAIVLMAYTFKIEYRETTKFGQADGLSRLPLTSAELFDIQDLGMSQVVYAIQLENLKQTPVHAEQIKTATTKDPVLVRVREFILSGWPTKIGTAFAPYHRHRLEMSVVNGCVIWGIRTVIPKKFQQQLLKYLHQTHAGVVRMKSDARSYFWWPEIDKEIEELTKNCPNCSTITKETPKVPLQQWNVPETPWKRVHIDFAGPFKGAMFFVLVDAHSKWPEVVQMKRTLASDVVSVLENLFTRYGIVEEIVSDNGPQFAGYEFAEFCKSYGIRHHRSAPGHPQSNGQAERYVDSFKTAIKKATFDGGKVEDALRQYLFRYQSTAHATTGVSPAELFLKRKFRTTLDLLKPEKNDRQDRERYRQKKNFDRNVRPKSLGEGERVMVKDFRNSNPHGWTPARLTRREGARNWEVDVGGQIWKRHEDQIRTRQWTAPAEDPVKSPTSPTTEDPPNEAEQMEVENNTTLEPANNVAVQERIEEMEEEVPETVPLLPVEPEQPSRGKRKEPPVSTALKSPRPKRNLVRPDYRRLHNGSN